METITQSQILNVILSIPNGQLGSIVTKKEPAMNKRGNPYLMEDIQVTKRQTVLFNFNYANSVNNRREKLGLPRDFVPAPRKWGSPIEESKHVIEHKGNLYADAQLINSGKAHYTINGEEVDKETLAPFLKKRKPSETATLTAKEIAEMSQEEIEKWSCENVKFRDFKFSNIVEIRANGKVYKVAK